MSIEPHQIISLLRGYRFPLNDEKALQREIHSVLQECYPVMSEVKLDDKSRIDFVVDNDIGIEVKIKGQPMNIYRQLERYLEGERLKSLILVTNKAMGLPEQIGGKDVYYLSLGESWL